ncbi:hypothetical protein lbkm_1555 [Lachnospiraceae bacterium KM106-2]|nr:hypothetical protein lbkm_1555 [Lachnospiraceae bacterium KM106-2]
MLIFSLYGCDQDKVTKEHPEKVETSKKKKTKEVTENKNKQKSDLVIVNNGYQSAAVQVSKSKKSTGTFREEELVDNTVTIVNERLEASDHGENAIRKLIEKQEGKVTSYSIQQDDYLSETLSYPAYKVSYQTMKDNESISNRDVIVQTDDWNLRYHTAVSFDFAENYYDIIDQWMKSLSIYDRNTKKDSGVDTNEVIGGFIDGDGTLWVQLEEDMKNGPYLVYSIEGDNLSFVKEKKITEGLKMGTKGRHCFQFKAKSEGNAKIKLYYTDDYKTKEDQQPDYIFSIKTDASKVVSMNMTAKK